MYTNGYEHCYHFETSSKPIIELLRITKGDEGDLMLNTNEVVFIMEGRVQLIFGDFQHSEGVKGQALFLLAGGRYSYHVTAPSVVMVFRIHDPIRLCSTFSLEKLREGGSGGDKDKPGRRNFNTLEMNSYIWQLLEGINESLCGGVRCKEYFNLKINEFFILLRTFYTNEDLYWFFYLIISGDITFSEYVRLNWYKFRSVGEFAACMGINSRQFFTKFKTVFGQTPYKWMKEERAKKIERELTGTKKSFKEIAFDNEFSDIPQFTKFCKKEIGNTPTVIRTGKII